MFGQEPEERQLPPIQIDLWDKNLSWVGPLGIPLSVSATKRRNAAGDCTFTIPALVQHPITGEQVPHPRLDALLTKGCRAVVTYRYADDATPFRLISGRIRSRKGEGATGQATRTFEVIDDWNILHSTLAFINPSLAAENINQSANSAYKISGPAETVALDVIRRNYNQHAPIYAGRTLVVPTSKGRGGNVSLQFRMDYLADVLFPAVDNAGIIIDIGQVGDRIEVEVREPDRYPITLTEGSGVVVGGTFADEDVTATRVIVGVGGGSDDIPARLFRQFVNTAAEAEIGEPLEVYVDGSSIALNDDITAQSKQMSDDAFAENAAKINLDLTLIEAGSFRYGLAFREGDIASVQLNNAPQTFTDYVRDVQIDWQPGDGDGGLKVTPHLGNWQDDADSVLINEVLQMGKAIRSLQRR
jgi:hypothetical protein